MLFYYNKTKKNITKALDTTFDQYMIQNYGLSDDNKYITDINTTIKRYNIA